MKRPADQAKLLFLYLLRSSAALATENTSKVAAIATTGQSAAASSLFKQPAAGHIHLRLATRTDVPSIQRCNLATLPENYNSQFYVNHLREWPELAIVAEHVPLDHNNNGNTRKTMPFDLHNQPSPNIVAYVLGKVEGNEVSNPNRIHLPNGLSDEDSKDLLEELANPATTEKLGHVTSLAVHHDYRRRGLAASLMDQLHLHLTQCYGATACGLHVRVSNRAATQLYQRDGYHVANVIPQYYNDGEDAYFMKKELSTETAAAGHTTNPTKLQRQYRWLQGVGGGRTRPRPWETAKENRLPRRLFSIMDQEKKEEDMSFDDTDSECAESSAEPQIMTGTY